MSGVRRVVRAGLAAGLFLTVVLGQPSAACAMACLLHHHGHHHSRGPCHDVELVAAAATAAVGIGMPTQPDHPRQAGVARERAVPDDLHPPVVPAPLPEPPPPRR